MIKIPNLLLASLPRKSYLALLPKLSAVNLVFGDVLYEPGERMREVYFPSLGMVSLLAVVEGHLALEVGLVGSEGMIGVPLALGIDASPVRVLVQGEGQALRLSKTAFRRSMQTDPFLQQRVHLYIHALLQQITQTAACNRFHSVGARLARWLLMTRDRAGSAEFRMTQRFLSTMLGVRRASVNDAAADFQRAVLMSPEGLLMTPRRTGTDGFFVSLLRRTS